MPAPVLEFTRWIEGSGHWAPWLFVLLFLAASFLMIWRLEAMSACGMEGTVLGTLVMPYCSGMGNLVFAFMLGARRGSGQEVLTNSLVNNVTNLTLLIGLPAAIWGLHILPRAATGKSKGNASGKSGDSARRLNRLSLLLTITAALAFAGILWALANDGRVSLGDGIVLIAVFLFWQSFHVFEVLRENVRQKRSFSWRLPMDLLLLGAGACAIYISTSWLVDWILARQTGFFSAKHLGWISGWLMVIPNAVLAFYYARRGNPEVVYSSQVGDGHICIPLCVGIFALYKDIKVPPFFEDAMWLLAGATIFHFLMVLCFGRLPRFIGWALVLAYVVFLWRGLPAAA
jgi:cation:H+ antiporter